MLHTAVLALAMSGALIPPGIAYAQIASEIAPPTLQPPLQRLQGSLRFTGATGLGAPPGADRLSVAISRVTVEGGRPEMAAQTAELQSSLTSGRVAVSQIFTAAQALEAAYARSGFVLARVVLPAQTLNDGGPLRLVVVDGFIETREAAEVAEPVRPRIEALTGTLVGRPGITLAEIERALLLAGDTFGVALNSTLATGARPGGVRLILGSQFRPITGFVGFNNAYDSDLGRYVVDAGVEFNGRLGFSETIYLRATGHLRGDDALGRGGVFGDLPRLRTLAIGAIFPIGNDGLTFNIEATQSRTTPRAGPGAVPTTSVFDRLSFRLGYPVIRSRQTNLTALLSFDVQSDKLDVLAAGGKLPVHLDRLRIVRMAGTYSRVLDSGGMVELGAVASFGLKGLGARTAAAATAALPLSRQGADASFAKLELSGSYAMRFGESVALSVSGRAQTSFGKPLLKSEQFGIASPRELSAFASGSVTGDSGWILRAELSTTIPVNSDALPVAISPYVFVAAGQVTLAQPTALEQRTTSLQAFGLGLDLTALAGSDFAGLSVRAEYGRGIRNDNRPNGNRFNLVGSYRF